MALAPQVSTLPVGIAQPSSLESSHNAPDLDVTASVVPPTQVVELHSSLALGRAQCDLYYKGTPWAPEQKLTFPDATAALSEFALKHMLSDSREWSGTLLWTHERCKTHGVRQARQAFTVYPLIDGPRRVELAKHVPALDWAIISFTNDLTRTTVKQTDLDWEDERLKVAVRTVISTGYQVDVWTSADDAAWEQLMQLTESEYCQLDKKHPPLTYPVVEWLCLGDHRRRQKYQALMRQGLAGFDQHVLAHFDNMQSAIKQAKRSSHKFSEEQHVLVDAGSENEPKSKLNLVTKHETKHETEHEAEHEAVQEAEHEAEHEVEHETEHEAEHEIEHKTENQPQHDIEPAQIVQRSRSAFQVGAKQAICGFLEHMDEIIGQDQKGGH